MNPQIVSFSIDLMAKFLSSHESIDDMTPHEYYQAIQNKKSKLAVLIY